MTSPPRLFVFGMGYTGRALARALAARGWRVAGTARSPDAVAALSADGIEGHLFDGVRPMAGAKALLAETTHLLLSVPPDARGDPVLTLHGADIAGLIKLDWAGYLSTTGVYGDYGGEWVGEAAWLRPTAERHRRRVLAERGWLDLYRQRGVPLHVLRLPGIYGPGRGAIDQVRAGTARRIDKPGHLFSRIHVEDIANAAQASIAKPSPGAIYNVADDEPAEPRAVVEFACELLGVAPPPLVPLAESGLSEMGLSFWSDHKRVKNDRIKRQLGVNWLYPDYRGGLQAQIAAEMAGK